MDRMWKILKSALLVVVALGLITLVVIYGNTVVLSKITLVLISLVLVVLIVGGVWLMILRKKNRLFISRENLANVVGTAISGGTSGENQDKSETAQDIFKKPAVHIYEDGLRDLTLWKLMFHKNQWYKYGMRGWYNLALLMFITLAVGALVKSSPGVWSNSLLVAFFVSLVFFIIFYVALNEQEDALSRIKKQLSDELKEFLKCQEFQYELEDTIEKLKLKSAPNQNLTKILSRYRKEVLEPRRNRGDQDKKVLKDFDYVLYKSLPDEDDDAYKDEEGENKFFLELQEKDKVGGITRLKEQIRVLEMRLAKNISIPYAFSIFTTLTFLLYAVAAFIDQSIFKATVLYGGVVYHFTTGLTAVLLIVIILYLSKSFDTVKPTHQGIKFVLGKPYKIANRGLRFAPKGLIKIRTFPMTIMYYNVEKDTTMLVGEESQEVTTNISQPYRFTDLWDVIDGLGDDPDKVKALLEGRPGDKEDRGMIGDKVVTVVRTMLADKEEVKILDQALSMRKRLASGLKKTLNKDYGHLGLQFDIANTTDIDPSDEMKRGRTEKALSKVKAQTAEIGIVTATHEAKAAVKKAEGTAKATFLSGRAAANVTKLQGRAEAAVILAKFKANVEAMDYLKSKGIADQAIPIITTLIMGEKPITEVANALSDLKVNLFQFPGIDQILKLIGAFTGSRSTTNTEK